MAQFIEKLKQFAGKVSTFFGVEGLIVLLLCIVAAELVALVIPTWYWVGVVAWFLFLVVDVLWIYKTKRKTQLWVHMLAGFLGVVLGLVLVGLLKL